MAINLGIQVWDGFSGISENICGRQYSLKVSGLNPQCLPQGQPPAWSRDNAKILGNPQEEESTSESTAVIGIHEDHSANDALLPGACREAT